MPVTTFITDENGKRISAILPIKKYQQLLNEAEDLEDIKAYDKAMRRKHEFIPLEQALKELELSPKKEKVMYQVVIDRQAQKQLGTIPAPYYHKITVTLTSLAQNPRPHGYKKLKGRNGYRIRVGDYRIIYTVHDHVLTIYVVSIDNRKDVYR